MTGSDLQPPAPGRASPADGPDQAAEEPDAGPASDRADARAPPSPGTDRVDADAGAAGGTGRERLAALEARVREDLAALNRPPADWVPKRTVAGEAVRDVVVIGGGMCGLVAWHALQVAGIRDVRVLDRAPAGREGPWVGYARMETLRSPKQLTGPAFGMASLTFRAWFTARFGDAAWGRLERIPRRMWMDYLGWYATVLEAPVENGVTLVGVAPEAGHLRLTLDGADEPSVLARRLVLATGRDGTGRPSVPGFMDGVPRERWAHSSDDIDFAALAGRRVAVVGVGASAIDNAAEALEAGAREVRLLIRRERMPTINKLMGVGSYGFLAGYPTLPDEWRWRIMHYSFSTQTPAPHGSTLRVGRHADAFFHFGRRIRRIDADGPELELHFDDGARLRTDHVVLGTGFLPDAEARPELGDAARWITLWRDAYRPPEDERNEELGSYPWLGSDFAFREREPGRAPWLSRVHCFNYGAMASLGKVSGDIPGISEGAAWLARELAAAFYREDIETHWRDLEAYDKPELTGDEWVASELPDADDPMLLAVEARSDVFVHDARARDAVLSPAEPGALSHELRHALALRIARLEGSEALSIVLAPALAGRLAERAERAARDEPARGAPDAVLLAIGDPDAGPLPSTGDVGPDAALGTIAGFVDAATRAPGELGAGAIDALRAAGLADADIVRLAQLVAYFSWRVRVVAGLAACGVAGPVAPGATDDPGALQPLHELGTGPVPGAGASAPVGGADRAGIGTSAGAHDGPSAGGGSVPDDDALHAFTVEVPHWRPRVTPIDLAGASEAQRDALGVTPSNRPVSDYVLVLAHDPESLAPRSPLFNAVMYGRGGASRADRELATTAVSRVNGCVYCAATHASRLIQLTKGDALARAVLERDPRADPEARILDADPRERAIVRFAERLTLSPATFGEDDVAALAEAGLPPAETVDLVLATALFGWANRLMHLLGDPVAPGDGARA